MYRETEEDMLGKGVELGNSDEVKGEVGVSGVSGVNGVSGVKVTESTDSVVMELSLRPTRRCPPEESEGSS